ncbi:MAG TPA: response regulator, partial [Myxococcales bacterium]
MPKNLLLADDSKTIQQAVGMTFAREDLSVVVVDDGEAALQAAKQSKPDLILADVSMPRLGGYELCQRIRADAALKDVPVLLLGGPTPIDPAKAMAVGANGHMPKPFDSAKLIEHVKTILANPKAKPAIAAAPGPARPGVPPARPSGPPAAPKPAVSPGAAGTTMVMARPPVPAGAASRPISNP